MCLVSQFLGFAAPVLTLILGKLACFGFMTHVAAALGEVPLAAHQLTLATCVRRGEAETAHRAPWRRTDGRGGGRTQLEPSTPGGAREGERPPHNHTTRQVARSETTRLDVEM